MPILPEAYLRKRGLEPLTWDDALRRIESRLPREETENFQRRHRAFAGYPSVHTCRAFYDFVARHGLHAPLAGFRFHRLRDIAETLLEHSFRGRRVLDYGSGGGFLAGFLRDELGARVSVADLSPASLDKLVSAGFEPFHADRNTSVRFDAVLCADSLCEIHADDDDWLSNPGNADSEDFVAEFDARYGLAEKLAIFKPVLAPGGSIFIHEPVSLEHFWRGAARLLENAGWRADIRGAETARHLRLRSSSLLYSFP